MVRYCDDEQKREFVFLTNAVQISTLQDVELYKKRWQVEIFFKWMKQHLKIKKFWGTIENAVQIQIYTAMCTYCLVAIFQKDMQFDRDTYEVLHILNILITYETQFRNLLNKAKFQDDKERFWLNEPNLFIFITSRF